MNRSMAEMNVGAPIGAPAGRREGVPFFSRLLPSVFVYWLVTACLSLLATVPGSKDLIGPDNDDAMRLVEVRDFLNGQGWFDLMQYRLGLEPGVLMHWSRLIDLPIATLIRFYSLFLSTGAAEGAAAVTWPILLSALLLVPVAIAGRHIGGLVTMHIALGLGAIFVFTCIKFRPGALDHHNAQLAMAMWMGAMLVDPRHRAASLAVAGIAAALAIAIGAETVPLVAVVCGCVAIRWAWQGEVYAKAAAAFGLSFALAVTVFFVATVPPSAYAAVTCDNLSLGFYSLSAIGGGGLFFATLVASRFSLALRFCALAVLGAVVLVAAKVIAPQCLGDPLGNLDPLLVQLWLNGVTEARSLPAELHYSPELVGGFYGAGCFSLLVCLFRIHQRRRLGLHLLCLVLIGSTWAISLIQVRGAFFANLYSILPLSLLIADLRKASHAEPESPSVALAFILGTFLSVPALWGLAGVVWKDGWGAIDKAVVSTADAEDAGICGDPQAMAVLNSLPKGTVVAPSNAGADILRYTQHRALSGPYHRNQGGMLTELHVGLAQPKEAEAFLHGSSATILAYCHDDPQTQTMIELSPNGLYAALARHEIPAYLTPVGQGPVGGFEFYTVK